MTKKIPLSQGLFAKVSDEDYEHLSQYSWHAANTGRGTYACRGTKTSYMHREIMKPEKGQVVDHINQDTLDNRRENLRICEHKQNLRNRSKVNGNVNYKGVHKVKGRKSSYVASIGFEGKNIYLGYHRTAESAAMAYNEAAIKYHGEFAVLNVIPDKVQSSENSDNM